MLVDEPSLKEIMSRLRHTQYAEYIKKYGDEHLPLYHGTRRKESIGELKRKGICTFSSSGEVIDHIRKALQTIKAEKYLAGKGRKTRCDLINSLVDEISDTTRRTLFVNTEEDLACDWAKNNPEIVSLAIQCAAPYTYGRLKNKTKLHKLLTKLFGKPIKIKLKATYPYQTSQINTGKQCFKPDEIEWIKPCG